MDAEISELGLGIESIDRPVWREDNRLPVRQTAGWRHHDLPSHPYSIGICIIARTPQSYSRDRVWARAHE